MLLIKSPLDLQEKTYRDERWLSSTNLHGGWALKPHVVLPNFQS